MTVARGAIAVPDSTEPTVALLRELRRGRAARQAGSVAFWLYLTVLIVVAYGGSLVAAAVRDLRHPPLPSAQTPHVLAAAPAAASGLALLLMLVLLREALWRGPVTLPQATVDWLLDTPVSRGRLLRPRFRLSAVLALVAGAAVGIVPAAVLVALGLGGRGAGDVLRRTGVAMLSTALLFALATGAAGLIERYPASWRWLRRATPAAVGVLAILAGLAAWAALGRAPAAIATAVLWSGPWGWAAQGLIAMSGGRAPLWPVATVLLGAVALVALAAGYRAAAGVPGWALRTRAATIGAMSAAAASMDTRSVGTAHRSGSATSRRARFRLRPPRRRELVLLWRDLLAVGRAPSRLAGAVALAWLAVGLLALAGRSRHVSLVPVACALALAYLAAAWLCEAARLDAEDVRRSAHLPFRFDSLAWRHAVVPGLILLVAAGLPVAAVSVAAARPQLILLLLVTVAVAVAGAMVNVFRGDFPLDMFAGVDTPLGNTAAIRMVFWAAWGPVLAVVPMTALLASALSSAGHGSLARAVILGAGLAAGLGAYAVRRARRLRAA